jgi:hypothetical protein
MVIGDESLTDMEKAEKLTFNCSILSQRSEALSAGRSLDSNRPHLNFAPYHIQVESNEFREKIVVELLELSEPIRSSPSSSAAAATLSPFSPHARRSYQTNAIVSSAPKLKTTVDRAAIDRAAAQFVSNAPRIRQLFNRIIAKQVATPEVSDASVSSVSERTPEGESTTKRSRALPFVEEWKRRTIESVELNLRQLQVWLKRSVPLPECDLWTQGYELRQPVFLRERPPGQWLIAVVE